MARADDTTTLASSRALVGAFLQWNVASRVARSISVNEDLVLAHVAGGPVTGAELSRRIGVTSASMTRLVAGLEQRGLVRRLPDTTDGRRILLYPTKAAVTSRAHRDASSRLGELLDRYDPEDRGSIEAFLDRAGTILER